MLGGLPRNDVKDSSAGRLSADTQNFVSEQRSRNWVEHAVLFKLGVGIGR